MLGLSDFLYFDWTIIRDNFFYKLKIASVQGSAPEILMGIQIQINSISLEII